MPKKEMYMKTVTISPALPKPFLHLFLRSGPRSPIFQHIFLTFLPIPVLKKSSNLPENWSFFLKGAVHFAWSPALSIWAEGTGQENRLSEKKHTGRKGWCWKKSLGLELAYVKLKKEKSMPHYYIIQN